MARRRRKTATRTRTRVVRVGAPRASSPIVIRQSAPLAKRRRGGFRRARSIGSGIVAGGAIGHAIGGALYGLAVKSGYVQKLPSIPILGRTGTAALLLDFWARRGGGDLVRKAATAAAVLAGYQWGSTGAITGDDDWSSAGDFATAGYEGEYINE